MANPQRIPFAFALVLPLIAGLSLGAKQAEKAPPEAAVPLKPGEFGRAVPPGAPAEHIDTFDTLDFDVFSNQRWDRLSESHADDAIVSWPDGHDTRGIQRHIDDLKKLFVHAPDTKIKLHPIRVAFGDWTAVTGS